MPLEALGKEGGSHPSPQLSIVALKRKKIGSLVRKEAHWRSLADFKISYFYSSDDFSWDGGGTLPQNRNKLSQDKLKDRLLRKTITVSG